MAATRALPTALLCALCARGAAAQPRCSGATSVSFDVAWAAAAGADLYDLQYALAPWDAAAPPPYYASQTSATPRTTVDDLQPNTVYHLRLRARNASAVRPFGWSAFGAGAVCATTPPRPGAPLRLRRAGGVRAGAVAVEWDAPRGGAADAPLRVEVTTLPGDGVSAAVAVRTAPAGATAITLRGLRPGAAHSVSVGGCDPVVFRTARDGVRTLPMYRISTTGNEVDFLTDHNTGDVQGDEGFITHTSQGGHFYESYNMSVMTQYCVDVAPLPSPPPAGAVDGWVQYLSCNSGSAGPPVTPPQCACWNSIDRRIAHSPTYNTSCKASSGSHHGFGSCNCSDESLAASFAGVGRQHVMLPWQGLPSPSDIPFGHWYSTPAASECAEGAPAGTGGCAWARHPVARAVRGFHFVDRGFTPRGDAEPTNDIFMHNANVTSAVYAAITPRCCGC